jgi:hypothetical protein
MVLLTLAAAAHAEGPPCLASVAVVPPRVVVGQQVAYIARVLRRPDVGTVSWVEGLGFPSFRAEWLPGLSGHTRLFKQGSPYLVYEERRALFPMRSGRLEIPPASMSCALYAPAGGERRAVAVEVPASAIDVYEPPEAGRPHSFAGLVGPIDVKLAAAPLVVALGETVRVTVTLTGDGNLWVAPAPFGEAPFEGGDGPLAEVFVRAPELTFDPGEHLRVRRVFAFELVPRRPGRLVIPPYEVSFFDPTAGRFAAAKTEAVEISVTSQGEVAFRPFGSPASEAASSEAAASVKRTGGAGWPLAACGLVLLLASGAALAMRRVRGLGRAANPMGEALRDAERARRAGNPDVERSALARALRAGLERALFARAEAFAARPAARALSADELAERAQGDPFLTAAAEILVADERARFAQGSSGPEVERLRAAANALARRPARRP